VQPRYPPRERNPPDRYGYQLHTPAYSYVPSWSYIFGIT
jgi:hypothetical protein